MGKVDKRELDDGRTCASWVERVDKREKEEQRRGTRGNRMDREKQCRQQQIEYMRLSRINEKD